MHRCRTLKNNYHADRNYQSTCDKSHINFCSTDWVSMLCAQLAVNAVFECVNSFLATPYKSGSWYNIS